MTFAQAQLELDKGNGVRRPGWGARYVVQQRWTDMGVVFLISRYLPEFARPAKDPLVSEEDKQADDWEVAYRPPSE